MRLNAKTVFTIIIGATVGQLGYPPTGYWLLAVAVPPVGWALALGQRPKAAFRLGFDYGLGFFLGLLYWLVHTLSTYGALPTVASASLLFILCAYLALYPALTLAAIAVVSRGGRTNLGLIVAPFVWTGLEWVRTYLFTGFGWGDVTQALWSQRFALDLAPHLGVDGTRLVVALVMSGLAWLFARSKKGSRNRPALWSLVPAFAAAAAVVLVPLLPFTPQPTAMRRVTVGIVQGNIEQAVKWNARYRRSTLKTYLDRSKELVGQASPDLLLWPETAIPFTVEAPSSELGALSKAIAHLETPVLFGAPAVTRSDEQYKNRNSIFHMDARGRLGTRYDKMHLVPFGEFVPFGEYFPFIAKLVEGVGDFTPGEESSRFTVSDKEVVVGPLVCFESIFADYATEHVEQGAELLALVTNDAWFGASSAPAQHLAFAAWRAAETGLPLVRAANTGISAVFDHRGNLVAHTQFGAEEVLYAELSVPINPPVPLQARINPLVGPLCLILALAAVFAMLRPRIGHEEY